MKLTDVVNRINGNVDRFTTDLEYYIGGEHFDSNELEVTKKGILKENLGKLGFKFHFAFQDRDVIFMARNPHLRKAGMVRFSGLCSDASYILRSKDESVITQDYLAILLQSDHFWNYCESHKVGSVNFANNWTSIANYEFELPSIKYQKEISKKVWAAYRLKKSYKKLLSATEEMVKSQFIEMFGDPMVNDKQWPEYKNLSEVTQIVLGSTPNSKEPSFWDGDIRWITPAEMTDQSYIINDTKRHITEAGQRSANLTTLPEGSVLFSTRAPIGKVAIAGKEMCCNQGFKNFVCSDKLNNVYLFYTLKFKKDYLCSLGTGTTFKELSKRTVESLKIAVPPIELQTRFENIYNQADKSGFELRKSIDAIDAVIKSLINN